MMANFRVGDMVKGNPSLGNPLLKDSPVRITEVIETPSIGTLYRLDGLAGLWYECVLIDGGQEMDEIISHGNTIRPGYYQSSMGDVFDIANMYGLDMPLGTAVKYILRAGKKDKAKEVEDLQKAVRCIERAIELRCNNGKR
jgi:hypothetical protein